MAGELLLEAYPLTWPDPQQRTPPGERRSAAFKVGMARSRDDLILELERLGARQIVISSNVPTGRDGRPRADAREPADPGVAVYFERYLAGGWRPFVIACDVYMRVQYNLRAIGATVEALRAIQRHGASSMLEQAFTGFAALPPAGRVEPWWETLGVAQTATSEVLLAAYRELARIHHPDAGGDTATMAKINRAYELARTEKRS